MMRFSLVLLVVATLACAGRLPAASEEDLLRRDAEFSATLASGDAESFRAFFSEDAVLVGLDGTIARGRDAVFAAWKPIVDTPALQLTWHPLAATLSDDGAMGYTYGEWKRTRDGSDGSELLGTGRYATVWRRGQDGVWRVALDIGNADATPKAELSF